MDWLAGSRLHLVDIVVTRGLSFVPLYVLGFAAAARSYAYLLFVSFQAVLIHANVGWRFGPLRHLLATPQYHHWHHARRAGGRQLRRAPAADSTGSSARCTCRAAAGPTAYGIAATTRCPPDYWASSPIPSGARADGRRG